MLFVLTPKDVGPVVIHEQFKISNLEPKAIAWRFPGYWNIRATEFSCGAATGGMLDCAFRGGKQE